MAEKFEGVTRVRRKINSKLDGFGYEKKYEDIYNNLIAQTGDGFFDQKKDILILAAVIGFNLYSKNPSNIEQHKLDKKDFKILSPVDFSEYYHIIYGIIISLNDDIKDIFDNNKIVDTINKCGSLGIVKLNDILTQDRESYIRNFEDFLERPEEFLINMFDREKQDREIENVLFDK